MIAFFRSIRDYFSLVKFSHTVFAMPFALIGFSLAVSKPEFHLCIRIAVSGNSVYGPCEKHRNGI